MQAWEVALISAIVPAILTGVLPRLSDWWKTRQEARIQERLSNKDLGIQLRDELRADNQLLRDRVSALEGENVDLRASLGVAHKRITRLEDALRQRGHHDILEELG